MSEHVPLYSVKNLPRRAGIYPLLWGEVDHLFQDASPTFDRDVGESGEQPKLLRIGPLDVLIVEDEHTDIFMFDGVRWNMWYVLISEQKAWIKIESRANEHKIYIAKMAKPRIDTTLPVRAPWRVAPDRPNGRIQSQVDLTANAIGKALEDFDGIQG